MSPWLLKKLLFDFVIIDEILNEFENWLNWMSPWLLKKLLFDFVIRIYWVEWIFLKLVDKVNLDKILDALETGQIRA